MTQTTKDNRPGQLNAPQAVPEIVQPRDGDAQKLVVRDIDKLGDVHRPVGRRGVFAQRCDAPQNCPMGS